MEERRHQRDDDQRDARFTQLMHDFAQVESGKLQLEPPMASARRLHYAVAIYPASFPVGPRRFSDPAQPRPSRSRWLTSCLFPSDPRPPALIRGSSAPLITLPRGFP